MRVTVDGRPRHRHPRRPRRRVHSRGHICPKGPALRELHEDPDRLRRPCAAPPRGWEPIGWDDALDEVAEPAARRPARATGATPSASTSATPPCTATAPRSGAQAARRSRSRTQNRFDPNSQDSNPRLFACMQVYGDVTALPVPDIDRTDSCSILGANPVAVERQHDGARRRARPAARRSASGAGGSSSSIRGAPRRRRSRDAHHFIRPGGDAALLLAMLHVLFAEGARRRGAASARSRPASTQLARARRRASRPSASRPRSGIDAEAIRAPRARARGRARRAVVYGRIGTCQNEFGPVASWLIEALNVVTGNFDREGGVDVRDARGRRRRPRAPRAAAAGTGAAAPACAACPSCSARSPRP